MNPIRKVVAVALVAGAASLPLSNAQAWWGGPWNNGGWGGPWNTFSQWGPFNGNGLGNGEFDVRMHINARAMMDSATNGWYSNGPWGGVAPWTHGYGYGYRPYLPPMMAPVAPAAPKAPAAAEAK